MRGFAIDRCPHCTFVYVRDVPSEDAIADDYRFNFGRAAGYRPEFKLGKFLKNWYLAHRISWFARRDQTDLLEIGFGPGHLLKALRDSRFDYEGIDLAEAPLVYLTTLGLKVTRASLAEMNYPDARFDIIVGMHVLEHVQHLDTFIAEVRRVLKPRGRAFFIVPCISHWRAVRAGKAWKHFQPPAHLWYFTRPSMRLWLQRNGFRVIHNHCLTNRAHLIVLAEKMPDDAVRAVQGHSASGPVTHS